MNRLPLIALLFTLCSHANAQEQPAQAAPTKTVQIVRALTDPTKLDNLKGPRAANERLRKLAYHLHVSEEPGHVVVLALLRKGRSPIITKGPYAREKAEVDHIGPVAGVHLSKETGSATLSSCLARSTEGKATNSQSAVHHYSRLLLLAASTTRGFH